MQLSTLQLLTGLLFGTAPLLAFVERLSPDQAALLATAGLFLIAWELNRPGMILPGCLGLLVVLFAAAALSGHPLRPAGLLLVGTAVLLLGANLLFLLPTPLLIAATAALALGLRSLLISPPQGIHTWCAALCGGALGGAGAVLSRIALRARRAKAVN